jgi:hypothetical protein
MDKGHAHRLYGKRVEPAHQGVVPVPDIPDDFSAFFDDIVRDKGVKDTSGKTIDDEG